MSQLVLEGVSKAYDNQAVLREISIAFSDGVATAVVGPSGAGKSTLLQLLNGLVRPSAGTVRVFGQPIDYANLPALRRRIGYAVQGTGLFPHLRVLENITLLARLAGWPTERAHRRAHDLLDLVGLSHTYARRYPHELSGGEQQRVGLCRAMMLDPPLLLLDEAFGSLDAITRREIHEQFLELQAAAPRTVVLVTHDPREALRLGQRIVVLEDGRVAQHSSVRELLTQPSSPFVREIFSAEIAEESVP